MLLQPFRLSTNYRGMNTIEQPRGGPGTHKTLINMNYRLLGHCYLLIYHHLRLASKK
jgi:hypothetical protein